MSYTSETTVPVSGRVRDQSSKLKTYFDDKRTFKPVTLPQLARPNALKAARLEVGATRRMTTVNHIHYTILR